MTARMERRFVRRLEHQTHRLLHHSIDHVGDAQAARLVLDEGKTVSRVAKDLDLTVSSLTEWVERARADLGKSKRGTLTTDEREELARLRKENRELKMHREILRKPRRLQAVIATVSWSLAAGV